MARVRTFNKRGVPGKGTPKKGKVQVGSKPGKGFKKPFGKGGKVFRTPKKGFAAKPVTVSDFSGLIFMCNAETKKDCFKYHVFGFPEAKMDVVQKAKKGMKLFLFDIDQKVLHGIYKASSNGGANLVPEAFQGSEREFPAQIRFRIFKDCAPVDENTFKPVIKENYFGRNKFRCELSYEQVGKLMQLFRPLDASGLPRPKRVRGADYGANPKGGELSEFGPRKGRGLTGIRRQPAAERDQFLPNFYAATSQAAYPSGQLLANPEADALYLQKLDALDRRAYALDPVVDGLRLGSRTEILPRRLPDSILLEERSLLPPKGDYFYRDPYGDIPYRREILYGARDTGRSLRGELLTRPLSTLPLGYR
ncbi:hypothetical protein KP509_19G043400 [Ceratopteris richardii]|uniref:DCD domain-containing protein n=1 Tax=Ceratopteris richardii TaxID=49495 RepID=A0A8T2SK84_CERRI|nr:hypothetical protein KP509_19G043400 [Ceratopteris richardii]KAH7352408.1 hypothetical protein KP509_19G043400 [Ceratopteris richardii]KAH7352409.1 hypothetical protein KP509_19G043400 [Ceratopteris richardii]KAH7352410.1 hypothetical protein KP509_19G043400 [Ceratopteris richardii]KAH7352411.1 hypothetical protein KP509_19G043400 [Ceratopteris richardii]